MVEALTVEDINRIRKDLEETKPRLEDFMRDVVAGLNSSAAGELKKHVRCVVPRQEIKTVKSVVDKVNRRRRSQPPGASAYDLNDVNDLVGAKVLCAYPTDVDACLDWLFRQRRFKVTPTRKQAIRDMKDRDAERGYRGYHFILTLGEFVGPRFRFELQVKTLAEEAWDAKTHDVAYKSTGDIEPQLLDHMRLLSKALVVIDEQSEVLKDQIQQEELERELHQRAAVFLLLSAATPPEKLLLKKLGFPTDYGDYKRSGSPKLLSKIRQLGKTISQNAFICRAYGLLAVLDGRAEYQSLAATAADEFATRAPIDYDQRCKVASHIHWGLGNFPQAIDYTALTIQSLEAALATVSDQVLMQELRSKLEKAKNLFIYWVCEARDEGKRTLATQYAGELDRSSTASLDTLGFFKIVFGNGQQEIDEARELIKRARNSTDASDTLAEAFYLKHDLLARRRLDQMFRERRRLLVSTVGLG